MDVIISLMFALRFLRKGRTAHTLLGLLFWDILFADSLGAFET